MESVNNGSTGRLTSLLYSMDSSPVSSNSGSRQASRASSVDLGDAPRFDASALSRLHGAPPGSVVGIFDGAQLEVEQLHGGNLRLTGSARHIREDPMLPGHFTASPPGAMAASSSLGGAAESTPLSPVRSGVQTGSPGGAGTSPASSERAEPTPLSPVRSDARTGSPGSTGSNAEAPVGSGQQPRMAEADGPPDLLRRANSGPSALHLSAPAVARSESIGARSIESAPAAVTSLVPVRQAEADAVAIAIPGLAEIPAIDLDPNQRPNSQALKVLSGAVSQAVGSGLTFGLKAFVEEGMFAALDSSDVLQTEIGGQKLSRVLANVAGGAFVGLVSHGVGQSLQAYASARTESDQFKDESQSIVRRELNDTLTVSAPVTGIFTMALTGSAVAKAALGGENVNNFAAGALRTTSSVAAGFIQGGITTAAKSAMSDTYSRNEAKMNASEILPKFKEALNAQFGGDTNARMLKEGVGKILGGTVGMLAATYAGKAAADSMFDTFPTADEVDLDFLAQAAGGAAGIMAFLACWFGAMQPLNMLGQMYDARAAAQPAPEAAPAVEEGGARADDASAAPVGQPDRPDGP